MGERSVRRWVVLTAVLVGTTAGVAPGATAAPQDPVAAPVVSAPVDPADAAAGAPVVSDPVVTDPAPADPGPADPAPADPAPADPAPADVPVGAPAPVDPAPVPAVDPASAAPAPATPLPGATTSSPVGAVAAAEVALPPAPVGAELVVEVPAAPAAAPSPACAAMTTGIHQANNPRSRASLFTASAGEAANATRYGFTDQVGVVFQASTEPAEGLEPVYRMYHPRTGDFLWILTEGGRDRAVALYGYLYQQVDFYVATEAVPCAIPVYRYLKGDKHRLAASEADRRALMADGWREEGVKFWAAVPPSDGETPEGPAPEEPAPQDPQPQDPQPEGPQPPAEDVDTVFTLAVLPDTQYEVFGDDRFAQRNRWLVENREELDLRFAVHTGDVVSWDTPDHDQYVIASSAMKVLDDAGIPTSIAVGNHDTAAVAVGGSAVPGGNTKVLVRDTSTFNRYFPVSRQAPEGVFEQNKSDNHYQLFSAGGEDWMILTLELWPRAEVVSWAKRVVAEHPDHHVIVNTHSYLKADGSISTRHEYGSTSPRYLFDQLISQYPNIRMVFSGHVGTAASRIDVGRHGNKIASFLGTFHSLTSNPVRLVEIDTANGTVHSRFVAPINGAKWPWYDKRVTGLDLD